MQREDSKTLISEKKISEDNLKKICAGFVIDIKKCEGCGACIDVCPVGAIVESGEKVEILKTCISCGRCLDVCPKHAVKKQEDDEDE